MGSLHVTLAERVERRRLAREYLVANPEAKNVDVLRKVRGMSTTVLASIRAELAKEGVPVRTKTAYKPVIMTTPPAHYVPLQPLVKGPPLTAMVVVPAVEPLSAEDREVLAEIEESLTLRQRMKKLEVENAELDKANRELAAELEVARSSGTSLVRASETAVAVVEEPVLADADDNAAALAWYEQREKTLCEHVTALSMKLLAKDEEIEALKSA